VKQLGGILEPPINDIYQKELGASPEATISIKGGSPNALYKSKYTQILTRQAQVSPDEKRPKGEIEMIVTNAMEVLTQDGIHGKIG
jgi:hypothetical protein